MNEYLWLKLIHILSAVVITGTGAGIAFFMFITNRTNNVAAIYHTSRHVVLADWIFTTPAVIVQFITGLLLMRRLHYSFSSMWFLWVISLFIFIGCCWLPVLYIQYRLRYLAKLSMHTQVIAPQFKRLMHVWTLLGIPAFSAVLVLFWFMVFKPVSPF